MAKRVRYYERNRVSYEAGLALQTRLHAEVVAGAAPVFLSLEHEPVYTLGRRPAPDRFRTDARPDIPIVKTDRGGEITYHGPGQAVLYVILPLDKWRLTLPALVEAMEEAITATARTFGVTAARRPGCRGIFVDACKLASIGLAVHRDVTMHGLALNVSNDLRPFQVIDPCGLRIEMASLHSLGAAAAERAHTARSIAASLAEELGAALVDE